jgi:hypothetical protein
MAANRRKGVVMVERLRQPGTLLVVAVPARDRAERARRLQEELREADRPNLTGNMGPGGAGPDAG